MTTANIHIILLVGLLIGSSTIAHAQVVANPDSTQTAEPQKYVPSTRPTMRASDRYGDPFSERQSSSPLLFGEPSGLTMEMEIDTSMNYTIQEKLGDVPYRPKTTLSFEEYQEYQEQRMNREFMKAKAAGLDGESAVSARRLIPKLYISPALDRIFGGNYIDIQPTGFVNMDFGGNWQRSQNPQLPINQQRNGGFQYDQQISMNVVGKIGEKLQITANFDNNNTFDYQNNLKIEYTGYEEDIIKKIEIGNVSMPVTNSLMSGSESLFGIKTQLQFGKLFVTTIASRQQGTAKSLNFDRETANGTLDQDAVAINASAYDEYKHFFIGHYFRDNYEDWIDRSQRTQNIPSGITGFNNVQVYKVSIGNRGQTAGLQNIIALADLGESTQINNLQVISQTSATSRQTDNDANGLFDQVTNLQGIRDINQASSSLSGLGLTENQDYVVGRNITLLNPTQYTVNGKLGYITLRSPLNEGEALAIAYEYVQGTNSYQVGELPSSIQSGDTQQPIILKLLKTPNLSTDNKTWDLAMRNIYTMSGATGLDAGSFKMKIRYVDPTTNTKNETIDEGPENVVGQRWISLLGLDVINGQGVNDGRGDGLFDFVEGITFDVQNGSVIFPVLEPFGDALRQALGNDQQALIDKYVFDSLYSSPQALAMQFRTKDRFQLIPEYENQVSLVYYIPSFNIAEGSVVVRQGSEILTEGTDYIVDYQSGTVTLQPHRGGQEPQIDWEEQDVFAFSSKWLTGARLDYKFNENFNLGATIMRLSERTGGISRYSVGNEPLRNTQYGFDVNFTDESRFLTKAVDALPLISTKEKSTVSFSGEFAQLLPGTSNQVNGAGTAYLDDFESATTPLSLAGGHLGWQLGATPSDRGFDNNSDSLSANNRRAKIAWYSIDRSFYVNGGNRPPNIEQEDLENPYVKPVYAQDIFNQDRNIVNTNIPVFDIAYFPGEKGPYNYNNTGEFNQDGISNPAIARNNFGAIARSTPTTSPYFNDPNNKVEYVEFWLMDPFFAEVPYGDNQRNTDQTGKVILHLGEISEDFIPDQANLIENGLSRESGNEGEIISEWGYAPEQAPRGQFFDVDGAARENQDVGFDGLTNDEEMNFFRNHLGEQYFNAEDPSGDNFKFYLDESYNESNAKVIERYRDFNNPEGNSPLASNSNGFSSAATNQPDTEELREDNVFVTEEKYFEYEIDLTPDNLNLDYKYIVDVTEDRSTNGLRWYQFRIPIESPDGVKDNPTLTNVPAMRLYLTGWSQPVVLRMVNFQMVSSQWVKSNQNLMGAGFGITPEPNLDNFDVSTVNVEQNGDQDPRYVVPPGIRRDQDNSTNITRRLNEQSLRLCVKNLENDDARAVYKNYNPRLSLINFKRLKMFFHAEEVTDPDVSDPNLEDGDMAAFIRLGLDQTDNYYEIEIPLTVTPSGLGNLSEDDLARRTWPSENELNVALADLYALKEARNRNDFDVRQVFEQQLENTDHTIKVRGNPQLNEIESIMIGVRNISGSDSKSVCIWANELRSSDIDNIKGWAARANMNVQLADFVTLNGSTQYESIGFGGLQDRIGDRSKAETFSYDVSAQVQVDKLIPGKTGIKVPMAVSHGKRTVTPQFDPFNRDIELDNILNTFEDEKERDDYKNEVIQQETRRSINFMNVRKEKVKEDAKARIYDVENFAFSYAYTESKFSDYNVDHDITKTYNGSVSYQFNPKVPALLPFQNGNAFSSPYLQLIKDININPLPNSFSARASANRMFSRRQLQQYEGGVFSTGFNDPIYEKSFTLDRSYTLRWNIFQNLSLNYNAAVNAVVDEPEGDINSQEKKDEMWGNFWKMGRTTNFNQSLNATYRLPFDKIPITDWISADYRYAVDYNWRTGNVQRDENDRLFTPFGNEINNSRTQDVSGKFDLNKLYNKSKMLKKINRPPRRSPRRNQADTTKQMSSATKGLLKFLMMVKSVNFTWSKREGTNLPGFTPTPYLVGMDEAFNAPGLPFLLGSQDISIRNTAAENDWLVRDSTLALPFGQNLTTDFTLRANLEPFKHFKIQLDMRKNNSADYAEIFQYQAATDDFSTISPTRTGSYTISFMPIRTSFTKVGINSSVFDEFVENRSVIQSRLNATGNGEYGENSQDVLIPAFIAAYTGNSAREARLNPVPKTPMPNWRIDYAGLSKIKSLKDIFSSVSITHAYNSTFSISNYANATQYSIDNQFNDVLSLQTNIEDYPRATVSEGGFLVPVYTINQVRITERFAPLIGINMRTKSGISLKLDHSRDRNLLLDLSTNGQITEQISKDYTFDFGWTQKSWKFPFRIRGRVVTVKNEIQFRAAFTVRDTQTFQRTIDDEAEVTGGSLNYNIRPTLNYVVNQRLSMMMYFQKMINEPRYGQSFPTISSDFGVQVRFNLAP